MRAVTSTREPACCTSTAPRTRIERWLRASVSFSVVWVAGGVAVGVGVAAGAPGAVGVGVGIATAWTRTRPFMPGWLAQMKS